MADTKAVHVSRPAAASTIDHIARNVYQALPAPPACIQAGYSSHRRVCISTLAQHCISSVSKMVSRGVSKNVSARISVLQKSDTCIKFLKPVCVSACVSKRIGIERVSGCVSERKKIRNDTQRYKKIHSGGKRSLIRGEMCPVPACVCVYVCMY